MNKWSRLNLHEKWLMHGIEPKEEGRKGGDKEATQREINSFLTTEEKGAKCRCADGWTVRLNYIVAN